MERWKLIFDSYAQIFGQKINVSKSIIHLNLGNLRLMDHQHIQSIWQMVVASDNFLYLGAPICSKRPTGHWFSHCLNQTNSLLTWWNQKQLTMARTPDNNQISPGSDFLILNSTIKTFQWGGTNSLHLLAWDRECRPYNLGRLNIRSCAEFQAALLCKQVFKLFADQQNLWVISIINKYDSTFTTPIWKASPTWKMLMQTYTHYSSIHHLANWSGVSDPTMARPMALEETHGVVSFGTL